MNVARKPLQIVGKKAVAEDAGVSWTEYIRLEPGSYQAYCKSAKWYFDPGYKRWTCLLQFSLFAENLVDRIGTVPMWFNGGRGEKPLVGRRSRYLPEWVSANGSPPPRGDRLSPSVFIRRMARVHISDTESSIPYSVVRSVEQWNTGQVVNQSHIK